MRLLDLFEDTSATEKVSTGLAEGYDVLSLLPQVEAVFSDMIEQVSHVEAEGNWVEIIYRIVHETMRGPVTDIIKSVLPVKRVTVEHKIASKRDDSGVVRRDEIAGAFAAKRGDAYIMLCIPPAMLDEIKDGEVDDRFVERWSQKYTDTFMHELTHATQYINRRFDGDEYVVDRYANGDDGNDYLSVKHEIDARATNAALEISRAGAETAHEMLAASPTLQKYVSKYGTSSEQVKTLLKKTFQKLHQG